MAHSSKWNMTDNIYVQLRMTTPTKEVLKKVYYVGIDPVTGIMVVDLDFHILGRGLDNVKPVLAHNSEAARLEYNSLRDED